MVAPNRAASMTVLALLCGTAFDGCWGGATSLGSFFWAAISASGQAARAERGNKILVDIGWVYLIYREGSHSEVNDALKKENHIEMQGGGT
jgi:hypothetical protein